MSNVHYPDPPPVFSLNQLRLQTACSDYIDFPIQYGI